MVFQSDFGWSSRCSQKNASPPFPATWDAFEMGRRIELNLGVTSTVKIGEVRFSGEIGGIYTYY